MNEKPCSHRGCVALAKPGEDVCAAHYTESRMDGAAREFSLRYRRWNYKPPLEEIDKTPWAKPWE